MDTDSYCTLCQDPHMMTDECIKFNARCKDCGKAGHFRKDCPDILSSKETQGPGQDGGISTNENPQETNNTVMETAKGSHTSKGTWTADLKRRIVMKCVEEKFSPVLLSKIWGCSASSIRSWVRSAGFELPGRYNQNYIHTLNSRNETVAADRSVAQKRSLKEIDPDDANNTTEKCSKISKQALAPFNKDQDSTKATEPITEVKGQSGNKSLINSSSDNQDKHDQPEVDIDVQKGDVVFGDASEEQYKDSVLCISDVDVSNTGSITDANANIKKCADKINLEKIVECPDLNPGKYTIVSVHLEFFRSNKHSFTKLTQVGCVVHNPDGETFFTTIKPMGIEDYLDNYKLGGDLLQALHMTREDNGTFLFRTRFEAIEESTKRVCVDEEEALKSLVQFLQKFSNCLIVGVDENTVAILMKKLRSLEKDYMKFIIGFTYWKRVLKYLDVDGYKSVDLEEYFTDLVGENASTFNTALDIANVLMISVKDVSNKNKAGKKGMDCGFYKLCKKIGFLNHFSAPKSVKSATENIEVFSSFRPFVSASISAEKLEQVVVPSESDSETEEIEIISDNIIKNQVREVRKDLPEKANSALTESRSSPMIDADQVHENVELGSLTTPIILERRPEDTASRTRAEDPQSNLRPSQTVPTIQTNSPAAPCTENKTVTSSKLTQSSYWEIGTCTPSQVYIICPTIEHAGTILNYYHVHQHFANCHVNLLDIGRRCRVCELSVLPSEVKSHMRSCISNLPYWKLGNRNQDRQASVFCPSKTHAGCHVNYSNIYRHIANHHANLVGIGRLCPVCKRCVLPLEFKKHMSSCAPHGHDSIDNVQTANSATSASTASAVTTPASDKPGSVTPSGALPKSYSEVSNSNLVLPGLALFEFNAQNSGSLRCFLENYVANNFVPFRGGLVNCLWMYTDYQATVRFQGQKKVVSLARFIHTVIDVCYHIFNINVTPKGFCFIKGESDHKISERLKAAKIRNSELYFKGMRFETK